MLHRPHQELEAELKALNRDRKSRGLHHYDSPPTHYEAGALIILLLTVALLTLLST